MFHTLKARVPGEREFLVSSAKGLLLLFRPERAFQIEKSAKRKGIGQKYPDSKVDLRSVNKLFCNAMDQVAKT